MWVCNKSYLFIVLLTRSASSLEDWYCISFCLQKLILACFRSFFKKRWSTSNNRKRQILYFSLWFYLIILPVKWVPDKDKGERCLSIFWGVSNDVLKLLFRGLTMQRVMVQHQSRLLPWTEQTGGHLDKKSQECCCCCLKSFTLFSRRLMWADRGDWKQSLNVSELKNCKVWCQLGWIFLNNSSKKQCHSSFYVVQVNALLSIDKRIITLN